ncbi:MAG TPA: metallophosphoesterase family protein [Candidatus Dormibacteraeota bacterium]|jgi:putative phosphoesterase
MRVAALADVHGNLPALEAVLEEVEREKPDLTVFCGDVASGPMPSETIDLLRSLPRTRFVRGNADRGLVEEFDGKPPAPMAGPFADWCAKQINREQRDFLAGFEPTVTIDGVDGVGRVLFIHAVPQNDTGVFTAETPLEQLREIMAGVDADLVVCGHTHMQFDRMVDRLRVINAGSVGMTYGEPGACWAMLGPGVSLRRLDYDREAAARRIRDKPWSGAEEFARDNVINVPSIEEAMDFMRSMEAKQAQRAR